MQKTVRERYPGPWSVEEMPGGFKVVSTNGTAMAYVYGVDDFARAGSPQALSMAEALSVARAICSLAANGGNSG